MKRESKAEFKYERLWQDKELDYSDEAALSQVILQIVRYNEGNPVLEKRQYYWNYEEDGYKLGKAKGLTSEDLIYLFDIRETLLGLLKIEGLLGNSK